MSANRRDKRREQYSRNTEGWNAQGFFSPTTPVAYATEASLQEFVYADPATLGGTIGIYSAAGTLISGAPPAAGVELYIAQKNSDDTIKKSTILTSGNYTVAKTAYDAPVLQVDNVGFNGTSGSLNISIVGGLQEFVLSIRETTPANQPFPVMEGRAIVRSGTPSDYAIANKIVQDITNTYDFERNGENGFAAVAVTSDAVGVVAAVVANYTFTDGSNQVFVNADITADVTVGEYILLQSITSPQVFKVVGFSVTGSTSTIVLDRNFSGTGDGVLVVANTTIFYDTEANVDASNIGITVTGKNELVHFDTSVSEDLGDADITNTTDWNFGSGAAWQVASIEDECAVFDGDTTINVAFHADYGRPDLWIDDTSATTYQLYIIESLNRIIPSAGAPQNQTLMQANLVIAAVVGSDLETQLDLIFGT